MVTKMTRLIVVVSVLLLALLFEASTAARGRPNRPIMNGRRPQNNQRGGSRGGDSSQLDSDSDESVCSVTCPSPPEIDLADLTLADDGMSAEYTCNEQYTVFGTKDDLTADIFCRADGTWTPLPTCARDGAWSQWGSWSDCSSECDEGTQTRTRTCSDPEPDNGGEGCEGDDSEMRDCLVEYCITWVDQKLGWDDARQFCEDDGKFLLTFNNLEESQNFRQSIGCRYPDVLDAINWIGVRRTISTTDDPSTEPYQWYGLRTGTVAEGDIDWHSPNHVDGDTIEDECVNISIKGWDTHQKCTSKRNFFCQRSP